MDRDQYRKTYNDMSGRLLKRFASKEKGSNEHLEDTIKWHKELCSDLMDSGAFLSSNAVCIQEKLKDKVTPGYEERLARLFDGRLFASGNIVKAVNDWVNEKTKGMIPEIADRTMEDMLACLMNAVAFEAKWLQEYEQESFYT